MYYSLHTHSRYSARDALPTVEQLIEDSVKKGHLALGLTDHGNLGGIHRLYRGCQEAGIKAFPGIELYYEPIDNPKRAATYHMGVFAHSTVGWNNLIRLNNITQERFKYKPLFKSSDMLELSASGGLDGLYVMSGCYFGFLQAAIRSANVEENQQAEADMNVAKFVNDAFAGRLLIELQYHGISRHGEGMLSESQAQTRLIQIADELGTGVVITSDSHYINESDKSSHDLLKSLCSWSDSPDTATFPGGGYHLIDKAYLKKYFSKEIRKRSSDCMKMLLETNCIEVEELDTYRSRVPKIGGSDERTGKTEMTDIAIHELNERGLIRGKYLSRLKEEADLIDVLGFVDYILLTKTVTDFCRETDIVYNTRGSASGSLVCWLLGITDIDPIKYKLRFDRFLSPDRVKPPDIDLDVQHDRRAEVLVYLKQHYATARIGTWRELGYDEEEHKGSLAVKYASRAGKLGMSRTPNYEEERQLVRLSRHGALDGIGLHPAGVVVAGNSSEIDAIPMSWISSSSTMVTSIDMGDVESAGFVKLDVLGLRTLSSLKIAQQLSGVDYRNIKLSDPRVMRKISTGNTQGIFQLSGYTASNGCRRMKPTKFSELVDVMALFRPAAMKSGATNLYLDRRKSRVAGAKHHEIIENAVSDTYSVLLYQEQLMQILRELGMDAITLSKTLKAIKSSNAKTEAAKIHMSKVSDDVFDLCRNSGWNERDYKWLSDAMAAYAEYGFNKCVSADTHLTKFEEGVKDQLTTVDYLYKVWFRNRDQMSQKYLDWSEGKLLISAMDADGRSRPRRVKNITDSGVQPVWQITLDNGAFIEATANHRHLTNEGYLRTDMISKRHYMYHCDLSDARTDSKWTCPECHYTYDHWNELSGRSKRGIRSEGRGIDEHKVISVQYMGEKQTYDVEMDTEEHNFLGNGIVTHNSHAVSYARMAFVSAWYSVYYKSEFWTGAITVAKDSDDELQLCRAAVNEKVRIINPDVNDSEVGYTRQPGHSEIIRRGFTSIAGIGIRAATDLVANQPYNTVMDLCKISGRSVTGLINLRKRKDPIDCGGVIAALYSAGALDRLIERDKETKETL